MFIGVQFASNDNGAPFIQSSRHDQIFSYFPYVVKSTLIPINVANKSLSNSAEVIQADYEPDEESQPKASSPSW